MSHQRIMITGGSSYLGRRLTAKFSESTLEVTSVYHQHLPEPMKGVYPFCTDFSSPQLLAAPLRDIDTVYHLAWANNIKGSRETSKKDAKETVMKNLQMTENLIHAMESIGTRRIVFVSAIGAHKLSEQMFLKEKYLCELAIINSKIPEKIIVRSSPLCGGDLNSDRMIMAMDKILKSPVVYPIPGNDQKISPVFVDSMTDVLFNLESFEMNGRSSLIFEVTGSQEFAVKDMFKGLASQKGIGSKWSVSGFLGRALCPLFDRVKKEDHEGLRFRDYLAIQRGADKYIQTENPFQPFLPSQIGGFEKVLENSK